MTWKTTVIIPTSSAPLECLKWSITSLLDRSDVSKIDQIIVSINGPDSRTGSTSLQDQKEEFCKTHSFPITVIRSWSRIGKSAPIQMALSLVQTDNYLLMHDDVIVLNNDWQKEAESWLQTDVSGIVLPPVFSHKLTTTVYEATPYKNYSSTITYLPSLNTCFSIFKTSANLFWAEYNCNIKEPPDIESKTFVAKINDFYLTKPETYTILAGEGFSAKMKEYTAIDIPTYCKAIKVNFSHSAWATYQIICEGKIATFSNVAHHLGSMSSKQTSEWEVKNPDFIVRELIKEPQIEYKNIKPLVCVLVYDRIDNVTHWINTWKKAHKYNGKLLVVQNVDNSEKFKDIAHTIQKLGPDYHWIRRNDNQSLKHFFELLDVKDIDFDWNVLLAFTDDCIPLRKDFLMPFVKIMSERERLGVTGGVMANFKRDEVENSAYFQRSICLGIRKEVLKDIKELAYQSNNFSIDLEFNIWSFAKKFGWEVSPVEYDWSLTFGWDSHHQKINDLWEKANFNIFGKESELRYLR